MPFYLRTKRGSLLLLLCLAGSAVSSAAAQQRELVWSLKSDPGSLDPAKVDDQAAEMLRYLTGGVLLRLNRASLQVEPDLASSWELSKDGLTATLHLRSGLRFSDGSPLDAKSAAASIQRVLAPATEAAVASQFLAPQKVRVTAPDPLTIKVQLPNSIASMGKLFDEIAIEPVGGSKSAVTAGPYVLAEYKQGQYLRLKRNPYYWRRDPAGKPLPYIDTVRLDILPNRETDLLRFERGEYQLIDGLSADGFVRLARSRPDSVHDLGPSLNTEQLWFNESPTSPLPPWEKSWFTDRVFRVAVSEAIHRADLCRIAYSGHATPATGFISPANRNWFNQHLQSPSENLAQAQAALEKEGFHRQNAHLVDPTGHEVKFSILTNAGNRAREKMAALIQQDLAALGMQVNVVTLDFPALLERLQHSQDYQAALLGLVSVDPEPASMMNVWLSSSPSHQWNPSQKTPATPWEAEIDRQMEIVGTSTDFTQRREALDRVQQIVADQQPFIYLVYPNMLYAVSPDLTGVVLTLLQPGIVSNIDNIRYKSAKP
jgi:peptide/nickel transport system substrate-binding protein